MSKNYYTGIGARKTPNNICSLMTLIASRAVEQGFILRSGGAYGADSAFAAGASDTAEIFRPLGDVSYQTTYIWQYPDNLWDHAMHIASQVHPAWHRCTNYARALHARNAFQVLGRNLDMPSQIVVCWTPDGAQTEAECTRETGGTGTAIRIASRQGVPVHNLARPETLERYVYKILES